MPWTVYNSDGKVLQSAEVSSNSITNAKMADDAIGVAELSATGTASSSVFLRGDNAWAAAGGTAPVSGRVKRTSADISTSSTSLVDVTGATITFTTGANPILYGATATWRNGTTGGDAYFNVMIDSTLEMGTSGSPSHTIHAATANANASFTNQSAALSAASHTIKMQWKVTSGTMVLLARSSTAFTFWAHEIR